MARSKVSMLVLIAGSAMASRASGAIVGVTGQTTWLGVAPPICTPTSLTGPNAYVWDERQNVNLNLAVDMVNNPGFSNAVPIPGVISGVYDSHFIHFEGNTTGFQAAGTITFNNPIVAVIFNPTNLDNSDGPAGAPLTIYPTGYPWRGLPTAPSSYVQISGNWLHFDLNTISPITVVDQIRVITQAPAPASGALMGLAGAVLMRRRR